MNPTKENLLDVLRVLFKWKKPIIGIVLAVGVITAIASLLFMDTYYKATTTFYAASPRLHSPSIIFGDEGTVLDFYGEGDDIDRLLQCSGSNELVDYMVKEFNLYETYDIDSTKKKAAYKVRQKFFNLYSVVKNERDAVELSIEDTDQERVAEMTNAARNKVDEIGKKLLFGSQAEILKSYEVQIEEKTKSLAEIADSLSVLRNKYKIFDAGMQRKFLGSKLPALKGNIAATKARLDNYKKTGGPRDSIRVLGTRLFGYEEQLKALTTDESGLDVSIGLSKIAKLNEEEAMIQENLAEDKDKFKRYKAAFEVPKSSMFVQDHAERPVVKSRPKRSIVCLGAMFAAFMFSVIGVLLIEYNRDVDWKEIINAK